MHFPIMEESKMKRLDWFKFNPMDWLAGSIQLLSDAEKGTYIDLCALIWKAGGELENNKLLHRKLRLDNATACDRINSYCHLEILAMQDDVLSVKFLSEQLKEIESTANQNAENARKRWENKDYPMRRDANKNKKEIKNKNKKVNQKINTDSFCPSYVPIELWQAFMEVRKAKKAAQTERALKTLINQLGKLEADTPGWANEEINASVVNSWKGIFPDEKRKPKSTKRNWY